MMMMMTMMVNIAGFYCNTHNLREESEQRIPGENQGEKEPLNIRTLQGENQGEKEPLNITTLYSPVLLPAVTPTASS